MASLIKSRLVDLQKSPSQIRNLCILAHVDHGKTTLADALVASNGYISQRMAGKLRYMDSRPDEQERGITMKSSAISLLFRMGQEDFLLNLIDSPGHVDFSNEVSTAVRLCDGAIVLVDVVEGVQPQTKVVLEQAYHEGIKPVLVLNKMDRLITEMKMTPLDAYLHLRAVLEQVNAVIGELFSAEVQKKNETERIRKDSETFDWSSGLDEADDSHLYFSPEYGNVIFASAYDGWAFSIEDFAAMFSNKLGFNAKALVKTMWGDYFINTKTQKIMKDAQAKAKKPLFVQLILENIWTLYDVAMERKDKDQLVKIIDKLQIKVHPRELRSNDTRQHIRAIFTQWLPLASCLLTMVCHKLPAPNKLSEERVLKLICSKSRKFDSLDDRTQKLKRDFLACSSDADSPVILFVSKMFPVQRNQLPKNKPKPLTAEEMAERREKAMKRIQEEKDIRAEMSTEALEAMRLDKTEEEEKNLENKTVFLALARVFSGTLQKGKQVYVLGPKYDPQVALEKLEAGVEIVDTPEYHIAQTTLNDFYLLLGRDLEELEEVPAGNLVGIGNLENFILKSATVSDQMACPAFVEVTQSAVPILRVAVEPALSSNMPKLLRGLELLNQADANVQISLTNKGEHILVTAGEVHLERCLRDLRESYAGIEVNASAPIVPFRETIVQPPKTDMVNEALGSQNKVLKDEEDKIEDEVVTIHTPNKLCIMKLRAYSLGSEVTQLLLKSSDLLRGLDKESQQSMASNTRLEILKVKAELEGKLNAIPELNELNVNNIWSFGPKKCGPNILFNNITDYKRSSVWDMLSLPNSSLANYDSSIINGFQLACSAGPLCEEPLMGVAFVLDTCDIVSGEDSDHLYGPISGQIVSTVKEGCRKAFQSKPQRLMAAMYTCDIQVKAEVLGKLFASLGKRNGKVVKEELIEGSSTFIVTAHLPVVESFQFTQEIRRQTSGLAMPQLVFSHWETIDIDPFWVPQTEEEILHYGEKADSENQARRYMNDVRKKKGLAIDEKIVEFAEKQRTLTKMK